MIERNPQARADALRTVITELTTLAPRLTPGPRANINQCIALLGEVLNDHAPSRHEALATITLLTFDPEAQLGYVYLCAPRDCSGVEHTKELSPRGHFEARKDYSADWQELGIEFAASDSQQAFRRAADLAADYG